MVKRYYREELPYSDNAENLWDETMRWNDRLYRWQRRHRYMNRGRPIPFRRREEYLRRNAPRLYYADRGGVETRFYAPESSAERRLNARSARSIATLRRNLPGMYRRYRRRNRDRAMTGLLQTGITPYNLRHIRSYL